MFPARKSGGGGLAPPGCLTCYVSNGLVYVNNKLYFKFPIHIINYIPCANSSASSLRCKVTYGESEKRKIISQ